MTIGPLVGRRVVVTRADGQADSMVTALSALGAEVVRVPLIEVVDPADGGTALRAALQRLDRYDWLVVTSPNGAARVAGALGRAAIPGLKVAAVGRATAEALGRTADLVPDRQLAEGLVDAFPRGPGRVLLAQVAAASPVMADGLTAKGWAVDAVEAYRTRPVDNATSRAIPEADAVCFTSGSTVRAWVGAFGPSTGTAVAAVIGPVTAAVAAELGLKVQVVAPDHSVNGLAEALASYPGWGRGSSPGGAR